jgi:transposase-like protein
MAAIVTIACPCCGRKYERTKKQINVVVKRSGRWTCKTCVLQARNKNNSRPIGAKRIHKQKGYVLEKTKTGWKQQHRLIIEEHIGREVKDDEAVHHINHIKTDNRLENLILMKHGEHTRLHNLERAANGRS